MSTFIETNKLFHQVKNNVIEEEEEEEKEEVEEEVDALPENLMRKCSISNPVDLYGQVVSQGILVPLLDRPNEMKSLMARNHQFYEALRNYISENQGNTAWQRFETTLYKSREKMTDRSWISNISHFLVNNPVFFTKFKEVVGYNEEEDDSIVIEEVVSPFRRLSTSSGVAAGGGGANRRRNSRRYSNMSFNDVFGSNHDKMLFEEDRGASFPTDVIFTSEQQFYQQPNVTRRRSSCYSIQSEPHPTFIDFKIDELDEAQVHGESDNDDDHLEELLDDSDDDEEDQDSHNHQIMPEQTSYSRHSGRSRNDTDLLKLRDFPSFQSKLASTHGDFFRKAEQLLSLSPSSSHFIATARRNSILQDEIPSSPVAELDEPRFQTCSEETHGSLAHLICSTRREQPDDGVWLNDVTEALEGWPELVDQLHDIIEQSLEEKTKLFK